MTKRPELATKVMRTDAGLHADQARRHIDEPCLNLATRPLLTEHHCTTAIEADDVEGVLAHINTDYGYCVVEIVGHSVLRSGAPCQLRSLTGQEHGRTIPLPDVRVATYVMARTDKLSVSLAGKAGGSRCSRLAIGSKNSACPSTRNVLPKIELIFRFFPI